MSDGDLLYHQWKAPILRQLSNLMNMIERSDRLLAQLEPVRELIKSETKYDLLLHESMYHSESANALQHKFNVPSVMLAAMDDFFQLNEFSGLLINPSYMVGTLTKYSDRMNFYERLHNAYILVGSLLLECRHLWRMQRIVDEYFTYPGWESRPPLEKLLANQSLILVNSHPSVGFQFPKPPHVKQIGGAVIGSKKPLPQDLQDFMDGAKEGVIYFSLGSVFDWEKAGDNIMGAFSKEFSRRKERILWKLPYDQVEGLSSNVKLSRWFPQQDILAHKNVKLFITHGGLQSTFEAVHHGVPVIVIPAFVDQMKNSLAIQRHGYGVRLLMDNITESSLAWALNEVLLHPKYKEQALKGSALLKDRIMHPVDEAVYWIEYVLRHGNVLQPAGAHLDFIQRHCIDVLVFIFAVVLVGLFLAKHFLSLLIRKMLSSVFNNSGRKTKND